MIEDIRKAGRQLESLSLSAGDKVVVIADGSAALAVLICACWKIEATVVPLSTRLSDTQIESLLDTLEPELIVSEYWPGAVSVDSIVSYRGTLFYGVHYDDLELEPTIVSDIIFTSGSSGKPKGVVHTIANHLASAKGSHERIEFGRNHTWLASLPIHHISGLSLIMRALLHGGSLLFTSDQPDCDDLKQVSHISLVPTQLKRLLSNNNTANALSGLRAVLVGGAALNDELRAESLRRSIPLFVTYGSSEMSSQITTTKLQFVAIPQCSGQLLNGRSLQIAADGEIWVKGETLAVGYYSAGAVVSLSDHNGWFHTGDLGRVDHEGNLFIMGRSDLMFISGGENIYPEEIERVLLSHPLIENAIVIAVADAEFGAVPAAFIQYADSALSQQQVIEFLRSQLEGFKIPKYYCPWPDSIPASLKTPRSYFEESMASGDRPSTLIG